MSGERPSLVTREGDLLAGKYRLVRELGSGGMGAVYEAKHELIGRRFAVKFLHPELTKSEDMLARFRREAQAAGALENENIVAVTDFGFADDGAPYMVMEHLAGEDVRSVLTREGRLSVTRAVFLVIQACRGLSAAHARGIIHRDLKPENLFLTHRGDGGELLKILDFGIAKLRGSVTSGASTRAGVMMGTLFYMPPEQIRGAKDIDHRADIYAMGAILYELLSGQVPHPGEQVHVIIYHILHEAIAPLAALRQDVPSGLAEAISRALAHDPHERHASVDELARALIPFAGRHITPLESLRPAESVEPSEVSAPLVETITDSGVFGAGETALVSPASAAGLSSEASAAATERGVGNETQQALVAAGIRQSAMRPRRRWQTIGLVTSAFVAISAFVVFRATARNPGAPNAAPELSTTALDTSPAPPPQPAVQEAESGSPQAPDAGADEPENALVTPGAKGSRSGPLVAKGKAPDAAAPSPISPPPVTTAPVTKPGRPPPKFDRENPYR
ncbi:MAG: serine/threonine protein kinase [Myxococcales bacterium]|nr:serine/threonine protein kinase [Myxococcales bacterium]